MAGTTVTDVRSLFEVRKLVIKVGESDALEVPCTGSVEEEAEVRTVTKNCRGVVAKRRTYPTGSGTLTISAHIPYNVYNAIFAADDAGLITGVKSYGRNRQHPEFSLAMDVFTEDDDEMLRGYPKCVVNTGVAHNVENGADEVAEVELEIGWMPDEDGNGIYWCAVEELDSSTAAQTKTDWLGGFDPADVKAEAA